MPTDTPGERLQKVLAEAGLASRRQAEQWIRDGRVTVNGQPAVLGQRLQPRDELRVDGRPVRPLRPAARPEAGEGIFLCHRSPGDDLQQGLIPRLPRRAGRRFVAVSPMPRVDGGLELLTSDGALAARLQRRVRESLGEFSVRVRGDLNDAGRDAVLRGELDDGSTLRVESLEASGDEGDASNRWYHIRAQGPSGKAIRQLFERQGVVVSRVMRTGLGEIRLTRDLGRGHFRELSAEEAASLEPAAPQRSSEPELPPRRRRPTGQAGPRPSRPAPGRATAERRDASGERSERGARAGGARREAGAITGRPPATGRRPRVTGRGPAVTGRRKNPR
jgi:23S rRNA pseudouridine2605 synthase